MPELDGYTEWLTVTYVHKPRGNLLQLSLLWTQIRVLGDLTLDNYIKLLCPNSPRALTDTIQNVDHSGTPVSIYAGALPSLLTKGRVMKG